MNLTFHISLACLSRILVMVAWNMSEAKHFIALLKDSKINYSIMLTTFFITIFVGVSESISVGLLLSFVAKKWLEPAKS